MNYKDMLLCVSSYHKEQRIILLSVSMGQIIKSVCVCIRLCVCMCQSVCRHSHGRISLSILTKFDTEV